MNGADYKSLDFVIRKNRKHIVCVKNSTKFMKDLFFNEVSIDFLVILMRFKADAK